MKSSLLALAAPALAANVPRGEGHGGHGGGYPGTTTEVEVTYTTTCPVTETVSKPGNTYTTTYTTTSICYTKIPTTIYETKTGPDVTKTAETEVYSTVTSLCPVTETKTVGGETQVITWTSTSLVTKVVPTTIDVYTTSVATEYETTDVYVTTECPETTYTTIVKGSTVEVTETNTIYVTKSKAYTKTEVIPVTKTKEVEVTIGTTLESGATVTQYPTVVVTIPGTVYNTSTPPPTTVVAPTTISSIGSTTSSAVPVTAAADVPKAPAAALFAGILGALAMV